MNACGFGVKWWIYSAFSYQEFRISDKKNSPSSVAVDTSANELHQMIFEEYLSAGDWSLFILNAWFLQFHHLTLKRALTLPLNSHSSWLFLSFSFAYSLSWLHIIRFCLLLQLLCLPFTLFCSVSSLFIVSSLVFLWIVKKTHSQK